MKKIAYKYQTIAATATAQPLVGTKTNQVITPVITQGAILNVAVLDSSVFNTSGVVGIQFCYLDVGGVQERLAVLSIPDATHVTIQSPVLAHSSGVFIWPDYQLASIYVQPKDGNAGDLFVGVGNTINSTTGVGVLKKLSKTAAAVQPNDYSESGLEDNGGMNIGDYWVTGTLNDTYLVSVQKW